MGCPLCFLINNDMCKYAMLCDSKNRIAPESQFEKHLAI